MWRRQQRWYLILLLSCTLITVIRSDSKAEKPKGEAAEKSEKEEVAAAEVEAEEQEEEDEETVEIKEKHKSKSKTVVAAGAEERYEGQERGGVELRGGTDLTAFGRWLRWIWERFERFLPSRWRNLKWEPWQFCRPEQLRERNEDTRPLFAIFLSRLIELWKRLTHRRGP